MAYKKLSEATFVESVSDEATVLVEEGDKIKRVPKSVMGKVKTVNGAAPDENGDVKVEIPEVTWESLPDKPFETLGVTKVPVLAEQTLSFVKPEGAPFDIGLTITDFVLEKGKTYEIVFDGETYQCDSFIVNQGVTSIMIGNAGLVGIGNDTGEPFVFGYAPENDMRQAGASEGDHVVSITMVEEDVKTIDPKYLPNTGGAFRINVTTGDEDNYIADKTYAEINDAISAGCIPFVVYDETVLQWCKTIGMSEVSAFLGYPNGHWFSCVINTSYVQITIDHNDHVSLDEIWFMTD